MRCALGEKKLAKYSRQFNKCFVVGMVRGNTGHRVDLFDCYGNEWGFWPNDGLYFLTPGSSKYIKADNYSGA